jgi:prepilin signal peptidase PulO-like enzyme (type II secretory pathway)
MEVIIGIFFALFGLCVGSFLNVVLDRFHTGTLFSRSKSFCFSCSHPLTSRDLLPIVSFFNLRGRCRVCGSRFSARHLLVETSTALLFLLTYLLFGVTLEALLFAALFSFLVLIVFYDIKHMIIPDAFSLPWNVLAFLSIFVSGSSLVFDTSHLLNHLATGGLLAFFFWLIWFVTRGKGMGIGDSIFALGIGFVLGFPQALTALLLSFWIGAIISVARMFFGKGGLLSRRLSLKSEVPFGPYLALGFLIALIMPGLVFFGL